MIVSRYCGVFALHRSRDPLLTQSICAGFKSKFSNKWGMYLMVYAERSALISAER
jgi:hypothetical protein